MNITTKELLDGIIEVIAAHNTNMYINMCKLQEECGELAEQTMLELSDRKATIDEIADVVICAIGQGVFIGMNHIELSEALKRKTLKGIAVGAAGGKAKYKELMS